MGVGGDDLDELGTLEIGEGDGDEAIGSRREVEFHGGGKLEEVDGGGVGGVFPALAHGGRDGVGAALAIEHGLWKSSECSAAGLLFLVEVVGRPWEQELAGTGKHGAGKGGGVAAIEDVAHFVADFPLGDVSGGSDGAGEGVRVIGGEGKGRVAGIPAVDGVSFRDDSDAGFRRGVGDADGECFALSLRGQDGGCGGDDEREDFIGGDEEIAAQGIGGEDGDFGLRAVGLDKGVSAGSQVVDEEMVVVGGELGEEVADGVGFIVGGCGDLIERGLGGIEAIGGGSPWNAQFAACGDGVFLRE